MEEPRSMNKNSDANKTYREFKQIINMLYKEEMNVETTNNNIEKNIEYNNVKIIPKLIYDKYYKEMKVEFKIGITQLYKIKNIAEFYDRFLNEEQYRYGAKLEIIHNEENFDMKSKELLKFILKYGEIIKYVNNNGNANYRYYGKGLNESYIILSNSGIDELFEILKGENIEIEMEYGVDFVKFIPSSPCIKFNLEQGNNEEFKITTNVENFDYIELNGKKYLYILLDGFLYRCEKNIRQTSLKMLDVFKKNFKKEIVFSEKNLPEFFSLIVPKLKENIKINVERKKVEKYIPQELGVKIFLDFDNNNFITAEVKFCYGEKEFNPLDIEYKVKFPRNAIEETECLNILRKTGFMIDEKNGRFILPNEETIYEFLTDDIELYMEKFEVLVTDNFKTKQIREPKFGNIGIRIENNLLNVDLKNIDFDKFELKEILEKYRLRKKYHRLKDGSFLNLTANDNIEFLNNMEYGLNIDYKDLEKGYIKIPVYRSMYLENLLKKLKNTQINKDKKYQEIVNNIENPDGNMNYIIPKELNDTLRAYQKTGFKWLKNLEEYSFGGILADDMGLGKTIQIIAVLMYYKKRNIEKKPSIVITPSSLALNWKNEVEKFAPNINVLVINGNSEIRKQKIESIEKYDLIITSYDSLKRDIEIYENKSYVFKYAIADEAQYIKNSNTQNAKALKKINAQTRFALTGTPIENSLAELWSIFDYIMPGYLFSYRNFKQTYEVPIIKENSEEMTKKLKMLINPFILRRIKKDVLLELPEKSITILNNEMEEEQKNIYLSYLAKAKKEAIEQIDEVGIEKSQIRILALLTRLRQICCHPSLFIENYKDGSSKLNQCIEIVKDGIDAGHKILLFSGYTSMFEIIEKELNEKEIKYYKLTGKTKVDERINLVDDFNKNDEIKVFLISLKAGGTGLNLIGADMVIHYDPWWNISAENQATDRAYRIGQKNNVQVYKLITKDSIEEKIYELQKRKAELTDNMLSTQATFINRLSKEDIMNLFA